MRCAKHGLAAGPDGTCALCRREALLESGRRVWIGIGAAVVATGGLCAVFVGVRYARAAAEQSAMQRAEALQQQMTQQADQERAERERIEQQRGPALQADDNGTEREHTQLRGDNGIGENGGPRVRDTNVSSNGMPREAQPPTASDAGADYEGSRRDERREAFRATERESQLQRTMRHVPVTMYMAPWCPACRQAKEWLQENGVSYTQIDVEQSDSGRRALRSMSPRGSIPTFNIQGTVVVGFDAGGIRRALRAKAEAELDNSAR